jgi:hypothetical protein
MSSDRYSMSFTTGSLFHRESVKLAALYLDLGDWNSVRNKVIAENLLQTRTLNTLKRVCREVVSRLKTLSSANLNSLLRPAIKSKPISFGWPFAVGTDSSLILPSKCFENDTSH